MVGYEYTDNEIMKKVKIAIEILRKNDSFLLKSGAHEIAVSFKLASYLQTLFPDWHVDCDYNRDMFVTKKLKTSEGCKTIRPDIIIHERKSKNNLLVIEMKTSSLQDGEEWDVEKLKQFTAGNKYHYNLGLFIKFNRLCKPDLQWFKNGEERKACQNG